MITNPVLKNIFIFMYQRSNTLVHKRKLKEKNVFCNSGLEELDRNNKCDDLQSDAQNNGRTMAEERK